MKKKGPVKSKKLIGVSETQPILLNPKITAKRKIL